MNFQTLAFLAFLALTVTGCRLAGRFRRDAGLILLNAASLFFCVQGGGWKSVFVLALGAVVSAAAVRKAVTQAAAVPLGAAEPVDSVDRRWLILAAVWHLGVLAVFKYAGFFTGGAISVGWVPLGLSFFTFQQLWLLKEVANGFSPASWTFLPLYAFFFPTLVSGPILKPQAFFPQLQDGRFLQPSGRDEAAGLYAIAIGSAKKVLLADNLGVIVDNGWNRLEDLSAPAAWLVILGYTLQLYLDFSGYCDIASGAARLLGLRLPVNFNSPYRSLSVGEFWKRWHITLTSFLRECLYFPLGGSRKGTARTCANILTVFLLSGLWHGAGWTFLVWGGLHGLAQIAERLWGRGRERLPAALRWALTFAFVNLAWVFFRAPDLGAALKLLNTALTADFRPPASWLAEGLLSKEASALLLFFPRLNTAALRIGAVFAGALTVSFWPRNAVGEMDSFRPTVWRLVLLTLAAAWTVLSFSGVTTFIYSNF